MRVGLGLFLLAGAVFFMASGPASAATADIQWPDTGQTDCYDNAGAVIPGCGSAQYPGQDGDHAGPARSYTVVGQTVSDDVTGLLWQQDGTDSTELGLAAAVAYATGLSLPGCSTWGLPTAQQLSSLVDAGYTFDGQSSTAYGDFDLAGEFNPYYWTQTADPAVGALEADRMLVRFRHGTVLGSYDAGGSVTTAHVLAVCQD